MSPPNQPKLLESTSKHTGTSAHGLVECCVSKKLDGQIQISCSTDKLHGQATTNQLHHSSLSNGRGRRAHHAHESERAGEALLGLPPVSRPCAAAPHLPGKQLCGGLPYQLHQHTPQYLLGPILPRHVPVQPCCLGSNTTWKLTLGSANYRPASPAPQEVDLSCFMQ